MLECHGLDQIRLLEFLVVFHIVSTHLHTKHQEAENKRKTKGIFGASIHRSYYLSNNAKS